METSQPLSLSESEGGGDGSRLLTHQYAERALLGEFSNGLQPVGAAVPHLPCYCLIVSNLGNIPPVLAISG